MQPHTSKHHYSAADIERYRNGDMLPEEAHALERAALDDPFLSDAVDGYKYTKTPAADVAQLRRQLQTRSSKLAFLKTKKQRIFFRVAALAILLAGFGWTAYILIGSNESRLAYQINKPALQEKNKSTQDAVADSIVSPQINANTNEVAANKNPAPQPNEPIGNASESKRIATSDQTTTDNRITATDTTFSKPYTAAAPMARMAKKADALPAASHTYNLRVVEKENLPLQGAVITNLQTNYTAFTDAGGNVSTQAVDTNLIVAVALPGYESKQVALAASDSVTTIELQRASLSRIEEVNALKKKSAAHKNVRLEAVEPLQGWTKFNNYIDKNLPQLEGDAAAPHGDVLLSFDVDRNGNAVNIIVEKPLFPSCDSTAVRLIREGSKWKKKEKTGTAKARLRY